MYYLVLVVMGFILSMEVSAAQVMVKEDYIGQWWTDSSSMQNKNQRLIIGEDFSVKWMSLLADGSESLHTTTKEHTKFIDDLAIITFTYGKDPAINKMVLSGWKNSDRSRIFGTFYMYQSEKDIVIGFPTHFEKGEGAFFPPKVRELLSNKKEGMKVNEKYLSELIKSISAISDSKGESELNLVWLHSEKPNITTLYTKPSHAAHPMVFMIASNSVSPIKPPRLFTAFAGDEMEANKLHKTLRADLESAQKEISGALREMFKPLLKKKEEANLMIEN